MPQRIQRRRDRPWQTTPKAICVDRSTPWGNPFAIQHTWPRYKSHQFAEVAVLLYEAYYEPDAVFRERVLRMLRGKDLACWCPLGAPCHADILLGWANSPAP
jgi:hypothetical protein